MFAILETGSKQYKVEEGDILEVELLDKEKISDENNIDLDNVLLIKDENVHIGQPFVKNARIRAKVLEEFKSSKIIVFKKKSKKQYKKTRGHRQKLHRIQIEKIEIKAKTEEKPKKEPEKETKAKAAAKPKAKAEPVKVTKTAAKPKAAAKPKTETKAKAAPKPKAKVETKKETKPKTKAKAEPAKETKTAAKAKTTAKPKAKPKTEKKVEKKEKE